MRLNINVGILYIESWLRGVGAAALYNLMEDAATAEISRAQIWQWIHHPTAALDDGRKISVDLVQSIIPEELEKIKEMYGESLFNSGKFGLASQILEDLAVNDEFADFLTLKAYPYLD